MSTTPNHKSQHIDNILQSPHGFFSPSKTNSHAIVSHQSTYILPGEISRDPQQLMESMMSGAYKSIDSTDCIDMMKSGELFYTYIESTQSLSRRQWHCHYSNTSQLSEIGILYFSEPGTKNEQTNRLLNLNKLTDIHLGQRNIMLHKYSTVQGTVNPSLCFSLYSDNRIFDLEANSIEQLCTWLYGINSIMSQSARNIVQADDDTNDDTSADIATHDSLIDTRSRITMAKRYSIMQPVRQSIRNQSLHNNSLLNMSHSIPAPLSDDQSVNEWAALQQHLLQTQKLSIAQLQQPINNVHTEYKLMKCEVTNELDGMATFIRSNMLELNSTIRKLMTSKHTVECELIAEQNKRKKLQNQLIELQGNIRVFCRVRPQNTHEASINDGCCIEFKSDESLIINNKLYEFDRVYDQSSTQSDVYSDVSPFVQSCIDGYNVCVFAYGQTGAGKSYTMEGPINDRGVNYRALGELFSLIESNNMKSDDRTDKINYQVNLSVVEIYNESLGDLLYTKPKGNKSDDRKLDIRTGPNGVYIPELTEINVTTVEQVTKLMSTVAFPNRHVRGTDMNAHSSRSHLVMYIRVYGYTQSNELHTSGKLILIDLAGSERISKSGATGDSLREAQSINSSLSSLGLVINSLQNKSSHIPYRDSKLTYLLQDCLGGSSKCLMLCQLSPATSSQQESICSLQFAQRARQTELGKAKKNITLQNNDKSMKQLEKIKQEHKDEVNKLEKKLRQQSDQLCDRDDLIKQLQRDIQNIKQQQPPPAHNTLNNNNNNSTNKSMRYESTVKSRISQPTTINESPEPSDTENQPDNTVPHNSINDTNKLRVGHKRKETASNDDIAANINNKRTNISTSTQPTSLNQTLPTRANASKSMLSNVSSTRLGTARSTRTTVVQPLSTTLNRPFTSPVIQSSSEQLNDSVSSINTTGTSRADEMRKRMTERKQRAAQASNIHNSASKKKQQWA